MSETPTLPAPAPEAPDTDTPTAVGAEDYELIVSSVFACASALLCTSTLPRDKRHTLISRLADKVTALQAINVVLP